MWHVSIHLGKTKGYFLAWESWFWVGLEVFSTTFKSRSTPVDSKTHQAVDTLMSLSNEDKI